MEELENGLRVESAAFVSEISVLRSSISDVLSSDVFVFSNPAPALSVRECFASLQTTEVSELFVAMPESLDRKSVLRFAFSFVRSMLIQFPEGYLVKKMLGQKPVQVLKSYDRFRQIMLELHHGMGHR